MLPRGAVSDIGGGDVCVKHLHFSVTQSAFPLHGLLVDCNCRQYHNLAYYFLERDCDYTFQWLVHLTYKIRSQCQQATKQDPR